MFVNGEDATRLASMIKLKAGRLVREVGDTCLQFWGGMNYELSHELNTKIETFPKLVVRKFV